MKTYEVFDTNETRLLVDRPIFNANRPIDALKQYLKQAGEESLKVKVSASKYVRFGIFPCTIENGKMYYLGGKRRTWFEVVH
jgi:hypothetical protein